MQDMPASSRRGWRFGWFFLAMAFLAGGGVGLILHPHQNEAAQASTVEKWKSNWPQLKPGMSKEQALILVGAPASTSVMDAHLTKTSWNPPNPEAQRAMEQTFDRKMNYAIWSYYGPLVIHTTPGEDGKTLFGQIAQQTLPAVSGSGPGGGHTIEFDGSGRIAEISP
jgi:hypothetical protein